MKYPTWKGGLCFYLNYEELKLDVASEAVEAHKGFYLNYEELKPRSESSVTT